MNFLRSLFGGGVRAVQVQPGKRPTRGERAELHRRIRRLEVKTSRLVASVYGGSYRSVFKGRGIEFDEVREYQEGDDPRLIDWNVTARMDRLFVKKFIEERELSVLLIVDLSGSATFGSGTRTKADLAAEVAAAVALAAARNQDLVGLLLFSGQVERFVPPRKGRGHVRRLLHEIWSHRSQGQGTSHEAVARQVLASLKHRSVLLYLSDFHEEACERPLRLLAAKHDLVPVMLADPRERALPPIGLVELEDPETGRRVVVNTSDAAWRRAYARQAIERRDRRLAFFRRLGVEALELGTEGEVAKPLLRYFQHRLARQGRARRR